MIFFDRAIQKRTLQNVNMRPIQHRSAGRVPRPLLPLHVGLLRKLVRALGPQKPSLRR